MNRRIIPLIMCGGAGTRLWPASREVHPKQFLPLFGARSTFQETLLRVSDTALFERPVIITNNAYRFMVLEQLAEIGLEADVLLEPMRRDSGPAIAAGAVFAQARDKDAIVLALAADHVVRDVPTFLAACREGLAAAEAGHIVTCRYCGTLNAAGKEAGNGTAGRTGGFLRIRCRIRQYWSPGPRVSSAFTSPGSYCPKAAPWSDWTI